MDAEFGVGLKKLLNFLLKTATICFCWFLRRTANEIREKNKTDEIIQRSTFQNKSIKMAAQSCFFYILFLEIKL